MSGVDLTGSEERAHDKCRYVEPGGVALRLGSAVAFGVLLGIDREVRGYDAGVRTHILVAHGAVVMTLIAFELYDVLWTRHRDAAGDRCA